MVDDVERGQVGELLPGNEKQGVGKINKLKIEMIIMIFLQMQLDNIGHKCAITGLAIP